MNQEGLFKKLQEEFNWENIEFSGKCAKGNKEGKESTCLVLGPSDSVDLSGNYDMFAVQYEDDFIFYEVSDFCLTS